MRIRIPPPRVTAPAAALLLLVASLWCYRLWQPARQVELHTQNLLARASSRSWGSVDRMIAPDYSDKWSLEKEVVLREMREIFRHYFSLDILSQENILVITEENRGTATTTVRIRGGGTAIAELVTTEVNRLEAPFTFTWERRTWKPWKWELMRVDHPDFSPKRYMF